MFGVYPKNIGPGYKSFDDTKANYVYSMTQGLFKNV